MKDNTSRQDKRGRTLRTTEERRVLVEEFKGSGLGVAEFCRRRDLRMGTFYHWVQREKQGRRKAVTKTGKPPVRFAEVQVAMSGGAPIEVELPGGVRIGVRDARLWPVVGGWIREVVGC